MDIKAYIDSGILELYVAGALSRQEHEAVYALTQQYPELLAEVEKIEGAIVQLTASASPKDSKAHWRGVQKRLGNNTKVVDIKRPWMANLGWAASLVLAGGLLWLWTTKSALETELETVVQENTLLEEQIENARTDLNEANALVDVLRDRDIIKVPLAGQAVAPEAYASVYWDKTENNIYLDVAGLPEPPEGKVYQVWSLTLDPLTPTSLGTIDDFSTDTNKIFSIANTNASEAFGITLEPEGGSDTPTLEQLYTLGAVEAVP